MSAFSTTAVPNSPMLGLMYEWEANIMTPKCTTCDRYTIVLLTPLLTPLSALHAETSRNDQQGNRLR